MTTTYSVEEITPTIAAGYLDLVPEHQRRRSASVVQKYARLMREGLWVEETPEPIAFDTNGHLVQGQHRLAAVVTADIGSRFTVARGVSTSVFPVLDSGVARQPGQMIPGPNSYLKAGATRSIRALTGLSTAIGARDSRASLAEVLASYEDWRDVLDPLSPQCQRLSVTRIPGSALLAVTAIASRTQYADGVASFLDGLESGADLSAGDPRLLLLRRAARDRLSHYPNESVAVVVKAWNAHARGETMGVVRYSPAEKFPTVVGYPVLLKAVA